VKFVKAHGAGNDFVLIDDREFFFPAENHSLIEKLCDRKFGIGADGLILLQSSSKADYKMRYFNSDGNEASLCGNGLRCFAAFAFHLGDGRETLLIETKNVLIKTKKMGDRIATYFAEPKLLKGPFGLQTSKGIRDVYFVDCGLPNAVFLNNDDEEEFETFAREVRNHPAFSPDGVNVTIVRHQNKNEICIRTYERGVEKETLACGTAALSVAKIFSAIQGYEKVTIYPTSLDPLEIDTRIWELTGPAQLVFEGECIDFFSAWNQNSTNSEPFGYSTSGLS
jgi:diaminopimelate epimerase